MAQIVTSIDRYIACLLMGLALILLAIKQPRIANYLPALFVAPLLVAIATLLGINIYPL